VSLLFLPVTAGMWVTCTAGLLLALPAVWVAARLTRAIGGPSHA